MVDYVSLANVRLAMDEDSRFSSLDLALFLVVVAAASSLLLVRFLSPHRYALVAASVTSRAGVGVRELSSLLLNPWWKRLGIGNDGKFAVTYSGRGRGRGFGFRGRGKETSWKRRTRRKV